MCPFKMQSIGIRVYFLLVLLYLATFCEAKRLQPTTTPDEIFTSYLATTLSTPGIAIASGVPAEVTRTGVFTGLLDSSGQIQTVTYTHVPARDLIVPRISYDIPIDAVNTWAWCAYPIAGFYSFLPRLLFYAVMLFSVLIRAQPWLVIGSLASGLTYSATTALHAMILVGSGHVLSNLNLYPITGILTFSAAMLMPLLSWSKTIRTLGAKREEDSFGRTVILLWAFWISFGSMFIFILIRDPGVSDFEVSTTRLLVDTNVACSPPNGTLDLTVGQDPQWPYLMMTSEFLEANGCNNICPGYYRDKGWWSITQNPDDLVAPTQKQANILTSQNPEALTGPQKVGRKATEICFRFANFATLFLIVNALIAAVFGRRTPSEIRNLIYANLARWSSRGATDDFHPENHRLPHLFAKSMAYLYYVFVVVSSIGSFALVIFSVASTEFALHERPDKTGLYEIDSWSPWVSAAFIIIIALASRTQSVTQDSIIRSLNWMTRKINRMAHGKVARMNPHEAPESTPLGDLVSDQVHKVAQLKEKPGAWKQGIQEFYVDNKGFWKDSWSHAQDQQKDFRPKRRITLGKTSKEVPDGWTKRVPVAPGTGQVSLSRDNWQDFDTFVDRCVKIEYEQRMKGDGEGFLWQPRVISKQQAKYRERYDWDSLLGILRRRESHDSEKTVSNYSSDEHPKGTDSKLQSPEHRSYNSV